MKICLLLATSLFFSLFLVVSAETQQEKNARPSIEYVKSLYEHELYGKKFLLFPAASPQRLLISFSWGSLQRRYCMWSWFWQDHEPWQHTTYLFLYDEDVSWYLGHGDKNHVDDFSAIIRHCLQISNLSPDHAFTVGVSMGGYAAIYYATLLGLQGAIAINPQVNYASLGDWVKPSVMTGAGSHWQDLQEFIARFDRLPCISLNISSNKGDVAAAKVLLDVLRRKNCTYTFRKRALKKHNELGLQRAFIEAEIAFFEAQHKGCYETLSS